MAATGPDLWMGRSMWTERRAQGATMFARLTLGIDKKADTRIRFVPLRTRPRETGEQKKLFAAIISTAFAPSILWAFVRYNGCLRR